jgi:hypothetical protein
MQRHLGSGRIGVVRAGYITGSQMIVSLFMPRSSIARARELSKSDSSARSRDRFLAARAPDE